MRRAIGHAAALAACGMVIEGAHRTTLSARSLRASLTSHLHEQAEGRHLDDAVADRLALGPFEGRESSVERTAVDRDPCMKPAARIRARPFW
jgi:hypothetical protein